MIKELRDAEEIGYPRSIDGVDIPKKKKVYSQDRLEPGHVETKQRSLEMGFGYNHHREHWEHR